MDFSKAEFEASYGTFEQLPPSVLPEIVFSGRSNVGKSSLINRIFQRKALARVSSVPGKTITINFYSLENVKIVDLPGYGYAKASRAEQKRWSDMIDGYLNSQRNIKLVVQLVDMRREPTDDDMMMIDFLEQTGYDYIIALTKSDKLNKTDYKKQLEALKSHFDFCDEQRIIPFSALNGEGTEKIREYIINAI